MKKIISVLAALSLLLVLLASTVSAAPETLYVYNWGEYISDGSEDSLDVNAAFEDYCRDVLGRDVKVNYSMYDSNEDMYAKLSAGGVSYDVIIPSEYMIARLIDEGLVQPIYPEKNVENYKYISDDFKNLFFDPDNAYSVPYTFGTVGVIYNTTMVNADDPDIGSWSLMWDADYTGNILQFNNPRDAFGTAQYYLGYSVNSANPDEWNEAADLLKQQKNVLQGYVMDEIFNKMQGGSAAVSSYYAGDFFTMYDENDDLAFFYPKEGTNVFVDSMCVPTCSQNPELAIEYINFMLSEEPAIANAEYICYASPNILVSENEEYRTYMTEEIHPDALDILYGFEGSGTPLEYYHDLDDDTIQLMNSLWEEVKIESSISTPIFVICGIIVAVILFFVIRALIIKKRRAD